jgi:uncharacterized protein YgbK (DUF1537 family)
MDEILVIADDLTGAADAGVMFCPFFRPVLLTSQKWFSDQAEEAFEAAVLVINTDTRGLPPQAAGIRLLKLAEAQQKRPRRKILKKIDSSLRGNIGAEADALVDGTGCGCSFIAAAFPAMGRTTVNGVHLIHGVPIAETELRHDPATPVVESRISTLVAGQSRYPAGHIKLEKMNGGFSGLENEIDRLRDEGCRHLTFDGTNAGHLERIVELAACRREKVLLVGTAGLAQAAAEAWHTGQGPNISLELSGGEGRPLYICGTVAERTGQQIAMLKEAGLCLVVELDAEILGDPQRRPELSRKLGKLSVLDADKALVLRVSSGGFGKQPGSAFRPAAEVARGIAQVAAAIVRRERPLALFCSGGDTAGAVMEELGAWGSVLIRELVPGTVLGVMQGGELNGMPLLTKPGSFGKTEDLVELHRYLMAQKKGRLRL